MNPGGHCSGGAIAWPNASWGDTANLFALQLFADTLGGPAPSFASAADSAAVSAASSIFASTPVLLYILGPGTPGSTGNFWVCLSALPATEPLLLYPAPGAALVIDPPLYESNVTFVSDPGAPVPTLGGNNLMIKPCGPQNQVGAAFSPSGQRD